MARALRQAQRLFDGVVDRGAHAQSDACGAHIPHAEHLRAQTPEIDRILLALLQSPAPLEIQAVSNLTGLSVNALSWRLVRLTQHGRVSRKRSADAQGERYVYFLDPAQARALAHLAQDIDGDLPLTRPVERILHALRDLAPTAQDSVAIGRIEKKMASAQSGKALGDTADEIPMTRAELTWRLACLVRLDQISRSRAAPSSPYQYFLRADQAQAIEHLLAIHGEAGWRVAMARQQNLEAQIRRVSQQRQDAEREIEQLSATLQAEQAQAQAAQHTQQDLATQVSRAVLSVQADPVVLSQRVAFLRKLRERPALEALAVLRDIEKDYEAALGRARSE